MAAGEHLESEYNSRKIRWSMEELAASKVEKFELSVNVVSQGKHNK
jgi:hypothetical protein